MREGFYPKAAALYKKVLKIRPDDEATQLLLADISTRQGLLADAKAYLTAVGAAGAGRGATGTAWPTSRSASARSIPPTSTARLEAARTLEEMGQPRRGRAPVPRRSTTTSRRRRPAEALDALRQAVRLDPQDRDGRTILARATVAAGDVLAAPRLSRSRHRRRRSGRCSLRSWSSTCAPAGSMRRAQLMTDLLAVDRDTAAPPARDRLGAVRVAMPDAALCLRRRGHRLGDRRRATSPKRPRISRSSRRAARRTFPTLLKLVEVCVDGGLDDRTMYQAQVQLADAYLDAGQAVEARVIAEDLVAREPWERAHIERFRRALVMLEVEDPDAVIADRLSGDSSFMTPAHGPVDRPL